MTNHDYVQYGCGLCAPQEWLNFDASPTLRLQKIPFIGSMYTNKRTRFPQNIQYGDIVKGLPLPSDSCKGIYCSHVLEHLSLNDFKTALYNTYTLLKPGGIFRLVLPDLEYSINRYIKNTTTNASYDFMKETNLGHEKRARGFIGFFESWLGNSPHLWMWDFKSLKSELEKAGFKDIRKASFGDSSDPSFNAVEQAGRWENCLSIECKKAAP